MASIRSRATLVFIVALIQASVPAPASAFSFSSLFDNDDDSATGGSASQANSDKTNQDNVNVPARQPLLDAEDWFLTEDEMTDSRGSVPRNDMATYSTGNLVTPFTASNEFFDAAYKDLTSTKEGDRVMLAAWIAALVPLKPDVDPTGSKTRFDKVMANVVERGASVNILGWASIQHRSRMIDVRKTINDIPASPINGTKAVMILDDRLPKALSSHHQKNLIIAANSSSDTKEQPVAYVGGLDFTTGRWDTMYHNASAIRDAANISSGYKGWDDSHLRIHGPAAKDVAYRGGIRITCLAKVLPTIYLTTRTHIFHPGTRAIGRTKGGFTDDPETYRGDEPSDRGFQHLKYSYEMVTPLLKAFPNKFNLYTTKTEREIFVHSKLLIVDDVYLSVGSANWNRRSMTSDSELAANAIDEESVESPEGFKVKKLARDFRVRKFQEMTGLTYDELDGMTFIESADKFEAAAQASDKVSILQHLEVEYHAYYIAITDAIRKVSDPQDTCTSD